MMHPGTTCSDDFLQSLLRDDEDSHQYRLALEHIDACPACQTRLEQLAAGEEAWREARVMLLAEKTPPANEPALEVADDPWHHPRWGRRPAAWTESMARQLLSPASHPEMLGRIGRYDVERLIGSGGMGVVFKAFDSELNRPVAVKVLAPYLAGSGAARARFAREARAAAAVVHEHVVAIHNVETSGTAPFLVMQFVAGESLQQRLDREGALELCEVLRIAMQTAAGLTAAHAQGLVHRDVKPSNILLEQGLARALLTDFGLARASDDASLTHTGYHPGTPQYMSPEQARGELVDARSDLFSLGSVIYTMCTGRPPFRAETSYGTLRRITDNEPRSMREINPQIPEWLERIVNRLHAKLPADRFHSAGELHKLLEQCLAHVQQPTAVPLPASCSSVVSRSASQRFLRGTVGDWRRRAVLLLGLLLAAGLLIAGASRFRSRSTPVPEGNVARPAARSSPAAPASPVGDPASSELDPATAWQDTATAVKSYRESLAPFETRSQRLWDDEPVVIQEQ